MSIVYILTSILLFVISLVVKKSDKKQDVIKTIAIHAVLWLCYNTFICYAFTMVHIPITLVNLSIMNLILSVVFGAIIWRKKERQEYFFESRDMIYIVILTFIVFLISYFDFGFPFHIKYLTTDSSIHYISAREFYENESLLSNVENIDTSNAMMPGAYSNIGILFKVCTPWVGEMDLYKVCISFDIVMLFLAGLLFFETIKKYAKNKVGYVLAGIVSIIYLLGYPLNNLLFGYFYLGIAVLAINAILAFMRRSFYRKHEKYSKYYNHILVMF